MEKYIEFEVRERTLRGMAHVHRRGCPAVMLCHGFTGSRADKEQEVIGLTVEWFKETLT